MAVLNQFLQLEITLPLLFRERMIDLINVIWLLITKLLRFGLIFMTEEFRLHYQANVNSAQTAISKVMFFYLLQIALSMAHLAEAIVELFYVLILLRTFAVFLDRISETSYQKFIIL